ncbi:argonaute-like protein [Mycena floridula]|nr:argonaute-like protein [Mycena floridula]
MSQGRPQASGSASVRVSTNCFEITRLPQKPYYQYDVITPDIPIVRKRYEVMDKLQNVVAPTIFNPKGLYDGKAILYSVGRVDAAAFTVSLRSDNGQGQDQQGVFLVRISRTAGSTINPALLQSLTVKSRADGMSAEMATATNLLQLLTRQHAHQKYPHTKTAYYPGTDAKVLRGSGLSLVRGYFVSVRPTVNRLLVNIDTTMSAMYQAGELINISLDHLGERNVRSLADKNSIRSLEKFLMNVRINTKTTKTKTKTIKGLVPRAGEFQFDKDGQTMTVQQYYQTTYNIRLRYPEIFGVRLSGRNSQIVVVVPAELCQVLPDQLYKKKLAGHLTAEAVRFSALTPDKRMQEILHNPDSPLASFAQSQYIIESGMQISNRPLEVTGRIIQTPRLEFAANRFVDPQRGAWNVLNQHFVISKALERWAVIDFCRLGEAEARRHVQNLISSCTSLGMAVPTQPWITAGTGHSPVNTLSQVMANVPNVQIIIVFLPDKADSLRHEVKHWGDCVAGVPTQCIRQSKLPSGPQSSQYWNNVALKINVRRGGSNSYANSPSMVELSKTSNMILGADTSHPGPGVLQPSVASLVWSHDRKASQYVAYTAIQHPREEMIRDLRAMVKKAILEFGTKDKPPHRMLFFRDGLSDGEYKTVAEQEAAEIKESINEVWKYMKIEEKFHKPKLTYVIVGKRHHITFYPDKKSDASDKKNNNCVPGFATGEGVLQNPLLQDFYLNSHQAIQGTSRSAHYTIILDENFGNNAQIIQGLAFDLCHVYAKATRSVSIPAPVYYADLACGRGAFHYPPNSRLNFRDDESVASGSTNFDLQPWLEEFKPVHDRLSKTMYFL